MKCPLRTSILAVTQYTRIQANDVTISFLQLPTYRLLDSHAGYMQASWSVLRAFACRSAHARKSTSTRSLPSVAVNQASSKRGKNRQSVSQNSSAQHPSTPLCTTRPVSVHCMSINAEGSSVAEAQLHFPRV